MFDERQYKRLTVSQHCIHRRLKRSERIVTQIYEKALDPLKLHITQFTLLVTSSTVGQRSIRDLAEIMTMDPSTLSRTLNPLEKRGLLEAVPSGDDARTRLISTTEAGEELIDEAYPFWQKAQKEVKELFEDGGYDVFFSYLDQFRISNT